MNPRVGVVLFPGTNCELDVQHAVEQFGGRAELLWHGDDTVKQVDTVVVPGGFAHGDYLRTGAIARFSPVMHTVSEFARSGGPVVGVCNGFQVLCEAHLLPGALQKNAGLKFLCETVELRVETTSTALTNLAQVGDRLRIPINHFEGNYVCDARTLAELQADNRVVVRYTDNPNGSLDDIAGICNAEGNVVGLMPHPERASDELLGSSDGVVLLKSLLRGGNESRNTAGVSAYAFGDSDLARERLGLVADTFAPPTRTLLRDLPINGHRYILDMGCGPGYTTALLREAIPHSFTTGIDASPAMIDDARARVPDAFFTVGDVTAPLELPAHLVYARLLLGHLPDPGLALAHWSRALRVGGLVVCEEPARYRSDDPLFARYEEAVTAVVGARGATLWAGPVLDTDPPACGRILDRVVEHPVTAARAAAMFWRNASTWGGDADLIAEFREVERTERADTVLWELRQTVWVKTGE